MPSLDGETPSLGAGLSDAGASVTGDAPIAEEPAQAGDVYPLEAPKPTNNKSANLEAEASVETEFSQSGGEPGAVIALEGRAAITGTKVADGLVTVRPKPEKRKNAKERAKEKITGDGTTPMTATAKSKVHDNAKDKAETAKEKAKEKAAQKAQKADTKARKISAAKAAKAARVA